MYRRFRNPTVWREFDRLQREMNQLFNSYSPHRPRTSPTYPSLNIWENQEGQLISAEMPGVKIEDIDISVEGDTLTISGVRQANEIPEGARYHRRERGSGEFRRSLRLPFLIDSNQVKASFNDGILTLQVPRAEADKPRKITIKS
ncbi:MAG: Hsp20/alpha crystallin family protein [Chloroflexota bacterium]|nr:MAG: Hsp20/alpha crystallin family protein [Chloroflexota bacterium]